MNNIIPESRPNEALVSQKSEEKTLKQKIQRINGIILTSAAILLSIISGPKALAQEESEERPIKKEKKLTTEEHALASRICVDLHEEMMYLIDRCEGSQGEERMLCDEAIESYKSTISSYLQWYGTIDNSQ